jgi:bacterioferritin-associated ferredoxin
MIVCSCKGISDRRVKAAIDAGATTYEELSAAIEEAGSVCGICQGMLRAMLDGDAPAGQMRWRGGRHAQGEQEDP